jgi:hypothetical protein
LPRFAEGKSNGYTDPHPTPTVFIPHDAELNDTVAELHSRISNTESAQVYIDTHLPCVFIKDKKLSRYVMLPDDVPQLATLPDLGPVIRRCLVHNTWTENFISCVLHDCIPSSRPSLVADVKVDVASACILLNILLATLLGLYPTAAKTPPFPMRAVFFRRVHTLLTGTQNSIVAFAKEHRPLLTLALTEYIWSTLPVYFPVETEALQEVCRQTSVFLSNGGQHFDAFRQVCAKKCNADSNTFNTNLNDFNTDSFWPLHREPGTTQRPLGKPSPMRQKSTTTSSRGCSRQCHVGRTLTSSAKSHPQLARMFPTPSTPRTSSDTRHTGTTHRHSETSTASSTTTLRSHPSQQPYTASYPFTTSLQI